MRRGSEEERQKVVVCLGAHFFDLFLDGTREIGNAAFLAIGEGAPLIKSV